MWFEFGTQLVVRFPYNDEGSGQFLMSDLGGLEKMNEIDDLLGKPGFMSLRLSAFAPRTVETSPFHSSSLGPGM